MTPKPRAPGHARSGEPMKRPPRQNDRGIPGQPGSSHVESPRTIGPGLSGEDEHPQEPIAPDERGD